MLYNTLKCNLPTWSHNLNVYQQTWQFQLPKNIWGFNYGFKAFSCLSKLIHHGWRGSSKNNFLISFSWGPYKCPLNRVEVFQAIFRVNLFELIKFMGYRSFPYFLPAMTMSSRRHRVAREFQQQSHNNYPDTSLKNVQTRKACTSPKRALMMVSFLILSLCRAQDTILRQHFAPACLGLQGMHKNPGSTLFVVWGSNVRPPF